MREMIECDNKAKAQGADLDLAFCKMVVEAEESKVWIEDRKEKWFKG